jgi:hypothetical protein
VAYEKGETYLPIYKLKKLPKKENAHKQTANMESGI